MGKCYLLTGFQVESWARVTESERMKESVSELVSERANKHVIECVNEWCSAMDWHPIHDEFSHFAPSVPEIHPRITTTPARVRAEWNELLISLLSGCSRVVFLLHFCFVFNCWNSFGSITTVCDVVCGLCDTVWLWACDSPANKAVGGGAMCPVGGV